MLVLEIAVGVCLGLIACIALWFLGITIAHWYKEQRWWQGYQKHQRMVQSLSRRYSRHLLTEAGLELPRGADALKTYVPIDGGEEKFDPDAMAEIEELGRRVDAMR